LCKSGAVCILDETNVMIPLLKPSVAVFSLFLGLAALDTALPERKVQTATTPVTTIATPADNPKIQAAILLDVSGSMQGLIEQAKAQLWNMVSVMGKAKCEKGNPLIEIALYEYGRDANDPKVGYIKQISGFTSDLDKLSQELFKLTTNGGSEYCGQVIYTSLNDLAWDAAATNYKVIFIAGNEDFLQGPVTYTKACEEARKKGVIVNTIYCGDKMRGIAEHWNLSGECGSGSYTHINHDAKLDDIATPYDTTLFTLNSKLNNTYIGYGAQGEVAAARQARVDAVNYDANKSSQAKRVAVKGNAKLYNNAGWDLVDAVKADSSIITKVDQKSLPASMQNVSRTKLKEIVTEKSKERGEIQRKIGEVSIEREKYITAEKARMANANKATTLETEVERIIREQAKRFNMTIE
jgi:hypothetical protein